MNNFGPWATTLNAGSNPQLSSFWKRRMEMLLPISRTSPILSRRNLLLLVAMSVLLNFLPTVHPVFAKADEEKPVREEKSPSTGRIYAQAALKITPQGSNKEEEISGIIAIDPETGKWQMITKELGDEVRVSPDGKFIAYSIYKADTEHQIPSGFAGIPNVWICDLKNKQSTKIGDLNASIPSWSPDGKQVIALESKYLGGNNKFQYSSWLMNLDGSGRKKLPISETDQVADWSRDGNWLVAITDRDPSFSSGHQLYRMHPDGSEEMRLNEGGRIGSPRFSPNSQHILYTRGFKGIETLRVMDMDGKNDREVLREEGMEGIHDGCFSPDSRHLVVRRFTYKLDEKGEKELKDPETSHYRFELMNIDGTNRRELKLIGATIVAIGRPDWH